MIRRCSNCKQYKEIEIIIEDRPLFYCKKCSLMTLETTDGFNSNQEKKGSKRGKEIESKSGKVSENSLLK